MDLGAQKGLLDLPNELLVEICRYLQPKDLARFSQCCWTTKNIGYLRLIWKFFPLETPLTKKMYDWPLIYRSVKIRGIKNFFLSTKNYYSFCQHIRWINEYVPEAEVIWDKSGNISARFHRGNIVEGLELKCLKTLKLSFISQDTLDFFLSAAPGLTHLNVSDTDFNNDHLLQLRKFNNITALNLARTGITDMGIGFFCENQDELINIEILDVTGNLHVTSKSYKSIKTLTKLKVLITNDTLADSESFKELLEIATLQCLLIKNSDWPEKVLTNWKRPIQSLCFDLSIFGPEGLTNLGSQFKDVMFFKISNTPISDQDITLICKHMPNLIILDLAHSPNITNQALFTIKEKLSFLKVLSVFECPNISRGALSIFPKGMTIQYQTKFKWNDIQKLKLRLKKYHEVLSHFIYVNFQYI